jgi:hypothetical protein
MAITVEYKSLTINSNDKLDVDQLINGLNTIAIVDPSLTHSIKLNGVKEINNYHHSYFATIVFSLLFISLFIMFIISVLKDK